MAYGTILTLPCKVRYNLEYIVYSIGSLPLTLFLIAGIWLTILTWYALRTMQHYNRLTQGTHDSNLTQVLDGWMKRLQEQGDQLTDVEHRVHTLTEQSRRVVQNVQVIRFNPFSDTGGDQSFVLTILDGNGTGVVLSSLHSRGMTRWYAKNVMHGKSAEHELSQEETQAVHNVLKTARKEHKIEKTV